VGGEQANVNRWRGQLSLPPLDDKALEAAITRFIQNGLTFSVVDFVSAGQNPQRIIGAQVPCDGAVWFFKLMGPDTVVESQKSVFMEFLKSVKTAPPSAP
jgi:hypothetical protein